MQTKPVDSNPLNVYSDLESDLEPGEPDSTELLTRYSTEIPATAFGPACDQIHVEINRKTREPTRVLPHARAAVPGALAVRYLALVTTKCLY